jgi:uncharacterized protein YybS (DUF2232 family)
MIQIGAKETAVTQEPELDKLAATTEADQLMAAVNQPESSELPDWRRRAATMPPPSLKQPGQVARHGWRLIRDSALAIAFSFGLLLASAYLPLLGIIGLLLLPLPLAALVLRYGLPVGLVTTALCFVLAGLTFGWPAAARLLLQYGLLGLMFGYSLRRWSKPLLALGLALVIAAAGTLLSLPLSLQLADQSVTTLGAQIEAVVNESFSMLESQGLADRLLPEGTTLAQMQQQFIQLTLQLLPAIMVLSALLLTLLSCLLGLPLLRRLGFPIARLPRFSEWRLDWRVTWGLIIGLLCYLLSQAITAEWLYTLGVNILYVMVPVFLVCGLAFVIWLFRLQGFSPLLKLALVFILLFFSYLGVLLLLLLVGLDSMLDLRGKLLTARDRSRGE